MLVTNDVQLSGDGARLSQATLLQNSQKSWHTLKLLARAVTKVLDQMPQRSQRDDGLCMSEGRVIVTLYRCYSDVQDALRRAGFHFDQVDNRTLEVFP